MTLYRIVYFSSGRDFAQRAQYEQKVLDLFERAYVGVRRTLSRTADGKIDVVLYTADEFRFHFASMYDSGVLGFYYSGKIRMNCAEQLDDRFYGTAAHEYVHAVVDDVGHMGRVPNWYNEGLARWVERRVAGGDWINANERSRLRQAAATGTLATFDEIASGRGGDVMLPYTKGATAIELLMKGGSIARVLAVVEGVAKGSFEASFAEQFGAGRLGKLDDEVATFLSR